MVPQIFKRQKWCMKELKFPVVISPKIGVWFQCWVTGQKGPGRTSIGTRHPNSRLTKKGSHGYSWRSSQSSISKSILFRPIPAHICNSGSFQTNYKKKFVKEKGKSNYSIMLEPPDVKHAMEVAKKQSDVSFSFRHSRDFELVHAGSSHPNFCVSSNLVNMVVELVGL